MKIRGKMKHNQDETEVKQGKQEKGDSSENEIRADNNQISQQQ
jgi:hypothetical protein